MYRLFDYETALQIPFSLFHTVWAAVVCVAQKVYIACKASLNSKFLRHMSHLRQNFKDRRATMAACSPYICVWWPTTIHDCLQYSLPSSSHHWLVIPTEMTTNTWPMLAVGCCLCCSACIPNGNENCVNYY